MEWRARNICIHPQCQLLISYRKIHFTGKCVYQALGAKLIFEMLLRP